MILHHRAPRTTTLAFARQCASRFLLPWLVKTKYWKIEGGEQRPRQNNAGSYAKQIPQSKLFLGIQAAPLIAQLDAQARV
jgi:hypothetical protein